MKSTQHRLDRFIRKQTHKSLKEIRQLLIENRIKVDGITATDMSQLITQFSTIDIDNQNIQSHSRLYFLFNKPKGVVCATKDKHHTTVIDFINHPRKSELHIAGRLDFNTSGLVLLTNDGQWSRRLSSPEFGVQKCYEVTLEQPVTNEYIKAFSRGIFFAYENITTRPCELRITGKYTAVITLTEGKYHQIKRMFGVFQNKVLELHRFAVGNFVLDETILEGESRSLDVIEAEKVFPARNS